jgi:hypothetical protein
MRMLSLAASFVIIAMTAQPTPAQAAGERFCRDYARIAVAQFREANGFNKCRRNDARWHANAQVHFDFCRRADEGLVRSEDAARRDHLANCKRVGF